MTAESKTKLRPVSVVGLRIYIEIRDRLDLDLTDDDAVVVLKNVIMTRGREETAVFSRALGNLDRRGLRPHCSEPDKAHWWLSEDPAERRKAAKWCHGGPVIAECLEAAKARGERHHVWGGVDFGRNPSARAD